MNKKAFHRINGIFLTAFVAIHMATHLSGLWGIDAYAATQNVLRYFYRNPIVEPLLLASFVVQAGIGFGLATNNFLRKMGEKWSRRQTLSGLIFLIFILQHLVAMGVTRWVGGLDTTFFWPASVMSASPFRWYFAPYYFLGISALFVHLGCAVRLHLLQRQLPNMAGNAFWLISTSGVLIALTVNAILLGAFYDIRLPPEWIGYLKNPVPGYQL